MKVGPAIAKTMDENIVAFDASNRLFNDNACMADDTIFCLLCRCQRRLWVTLAGARFLVWQCNLCTGIVGADAQVAQINQHSHCLKPGQVWWKFGFQHRIIMMVTAKRLTHKEDDLGRRGDQRVLQGMPFFYRCNSLVVAAFPGVGDRPVLWHQ